MTDPATAPGFTITRAPIPLIVQWQGREVARINPTGRAYLYNRLRAPRWAAFFAAGVVIARTSEWRPVPPVVERVSAYTGTQP